MTCPCDTLVHPEPLVIAAGQSALPRQIAGFPDYRLAMLAELGSHPALADWRARATGDLGVMLLEMWALLCDMVSFYDQVHAQEAYLRTATLETSVRGLVEMLGYVPRPAVAAEVELFAFAEGNRAIVLPAHTAFRSGVFGSEPPQVFELVRDWMVHPWRNRFALARPRPTTATASSPDELLLLPGTTVRKGDVVLVVPSPASSTHNRARRAFAVTPIEGDDGERYVRLTLSSAISFATATELAQVEVLRAGRQASLWTLPIASGSDAINAAGTELVLDGLHRTLMTGERVVIERAGELRWFSIESVAEIQQKVKVGTDGEGTDLHGWIPATRIALDTDLNDSARTETSTTWSQSDAALLTIHHALSAEATVTAPFSTTVADDDPLVIAGDVREPEDLEPATRFALVDDDDRAALVSGSIDSSTHTLVRDGGDPGWTEPLSAPVMLLANAVRAIRGETIAREVLGSGDAATANQRFALTKAPLTYVASSSSDSPGGVASTLKVWVNDLQWQEVPSFYGQGPDDPIFVVRTDRDGVATVCFGDGENGARLPTGQANIVASYRFGAGAATPPPDSITQIAKPVRGLSSIAQPIAPAGG
ncbi:MAG TPA: hypothetical protein VFG83_03365, partial [Kofleriaceae bacterium]|nr:hypothetical protein [Kofleriaceae bacterium]